MDFKDLLNKKIADVFQSKPSEKTSSGAWIPYVQTKERICELLPIEEYKQAPKLLTQNFLLIDTEESFELDHFIENWLKNTEANLDRDQSQELRDFIYEMF